MTRQELTKLCFDHFVETAFRAGEMTREMRDRLLSGTALAALPPPAPKPVPAVTASVAQAEIESAADQIVQALGLRPSETEGVARMIGQAIDYDAYVRAQFRQLAAAFAIPSHLLSAGARWR